MYGAQGEPLGANENSQEQSGEACPPETFNSVAAGTRDLTLLDGWVPSASRYACVSENKHRLVESILLRVYSVWSPLLLSLRID